MKQRQQVSSVFFLEEPPSANRWWRNVSGRMVTSKAAREYKRYVAAWCTLRSIEPIRDPEPVSVTVVWWRSRKAGDLDKRLGVVLDALQGFAFDNDSQIVELHAERHDATTTQPPGIAVTVVTQREQEAYDC